MTRVVVAGGSDVERAAFCTILHGDVSIETAAFGPQLVNIVNSVKRLEPHLVVLLMGGAPDQSVEAARRIMGECPKPIVLITAGSLERKDEILARSGGLAVLDAPVGSAQQHRFITMLKAMAEVKVVRRWSSRPPAPRPAGARALRGAGQLIAIAASTGAGALQQIFCGLPSDFVAPIVVVQHIAGGFADSLVRSLSVSSIPVKLARDGEVLKPRTVYIAPDDQHLGVTSRNMVSLSSAPAIEGFRPSATFLFESAAKAFGPQLTAVVLTGMGQDGIAGLPLVRELGGTVFAQDRETCAVFGMPKAAIESGLVDRVLPLGEIAGELSPCGVRGSTGMTKILIVEDSPTQAESLRGILEEAGCEVAVAYNAESALTKLDSSLDLVISDIVMPGLSGYELCKRIKSGVYGRNLPVMLLSTLSDPMDIIGGLESGADNFVTKPYTPAHLMERVNNVLENRKMRSGGKLRVGVEVMFLGRNFTINSDKEQILDLLMSTFEDIVRTNRDLQKNRAELAAAKLEIEDYAQGLERRVEERTRELASQKRLLAQAQSMAHVGNWRIHLPSQECEWSDEMYAIHGVSQEHFKPTIEAAKAMVHPEDRANVDKVLEDAIASCLPYHVEYRIVRPNGEDRYCWAEAFWEQNTKGEIKNLVGYCQDVTERKMAERVAKESAARYRHIVESMTSGLVILNEGRFLYVNEAACEIFGAASPSDIVGTPFVDALGGARREEIAKLISQPRQKGEALFREEKLVRAVDEKELDVEISKATLTFAGQPATQLVIRDITEKKALTQQLHQSQKMEVVGQLTGGIAHDFNNLLTVVISNLDMILMGSTVNAENRELAEAALAASLRGAELTRQLLAFSRKQALQRQTIDPNELVARTVNMLKRAIPVDVQLCTDLCSDLWLADIDPSQLESALTNLVVNARDAMPKGGTITIETSNVILDESYVGANRDVASGNYAMIAVSDTGGGIPASVLSRVFEPFFTTKEVGKGTGLGLSMVYGFMKQSGGHVKIYSEEGHGTVVRLYLPRSASAPVAEPVANLECELPPGDNQRILVVEDDEAVRQAVTQQLKELGYTVLEASDARSALSILQREQVDLLFTDVTMPGGVSGPDLAKTAVEKDPDLKVLMTSGFTEAAMRDEEVAGKFQLLSKPYRRQELAQQVHLALRGAA